MAVGLAVAKGLTVLVDVLDATSPWDPKAEKTGEKVEVVRVSLVSVISSPR